MYTQEFRQLMKAINLLSSTKEQQVHYLRELGTYPSIDELALEFDDSYKMYKGGVSEGKFEELTTITPQLERIDYLLKTMSESNRQDLWSVEALESTQWNEIRDLAKSSLFEVKKD